MDPHRTPHPLVRGFARLALAALVVQLVLPAQAHAFPSDWAQRVGSTLLIFQDHTDLTSRATHAQAARTVPFPSTGQPRVAVLAAHGIPGEFQALGFDEVVRHVRNNFPGFAQAEYRVLDACFGNVKNARGVSLAQRMAAEFGDVIAPNGVVYAPGVASREYGSIRSAAVANPDIVPTQEAWSLVRSTGEEAGVVSEEQLYRLLYDGESPTVRSRLDARAAAASPRPSTMPDVSVEEAMAAMEANSRIVKEQAEEAERVLLQMLAEQQQRRGGGASGYVGGQVRNARLRGFVRQMGSRAWRVAQRAPSTIARIGVGAGAGLIAGLPVEIAVTELTGNRHLGFAAGYAAGTFGGIAAEVMIFGSTWGAAASGAFSSVALFAAPAAVAAHMIGVALADLEAPIASGDPAAIDLAMELTAGYGSGFFWFGIKSWWNDPGGTAGDCYRYVTGR